MIREEGHIGLLEGTVLIYAVLSAKLFAQYPTYLIRGAGPAAWQAAIVMTAAALVLVLPIGALANRFPGRGLHEISEAVAGTFLGPVLTLLVSGFCFASLTLGLRNFAETYIATILPDTPPSVLIVVAILTAGYASWRGLESLARATQLLLPLILAGVVLVLLFSLPRAESHFLLPRWGYGAAQTMMSGLFYTGMAGEAIMLLVLAYAFRQGNHVKRAAQFSILLFGLITAATVSILIMIFGAPDAGNQPFALFNLSQLVYMGRFLQRTEALLVLFWFFNVEVRIAALLHACVITLTGALALPYHRPVIVPVAIMATALSFIPEDTVVLSRFQQEWLTPLGTAMLFLPALLLVLAMIRGKGGHSHAA